MVLGRQQRGTPGSSNAVHRNLSRGISHAGNQPFTTGAYLEAAMPISRSPFSISPAQHTHLYVPIAAQQLDSIKPHPGGMLGCIQNDCSAVLSVCLPSIGLGSSAVQECPGGLGHCVHVCQLALHQLQGKYKNGLPYSAYIQAVCRVAAPWSS